MTRPSAESGAMRTRWILGGLVVAGFALLAEGRASAEEPSGPAAPAEAPAADERTARGRAAFLLGVQRSKDAQWGEALAAFEEAAAARDAPIVQYNIGFCERALGRYVAARRTFRRVLASADGLAPAQIDDARAFVAELDELVVRVAVTLDPAGTPLTLDGRPLRLDTEGGTRVFVALPGPAGRAEAPAEKTFTVELDPGVHLFRAARPGRQDAFVQKTYRPGEKATLDLRLELLPARVAVRAEPAQALVRVDGREAGLAPIDIERPPGKYRIEVVRDGFETYAATLDLHAGQRADLTAKLVPVRPSVLKTWWFWTGAAAVLAGGAAVTYALTRPPPPYDGGSLNWVAEPTAIRW
ncbi:hypothetical protein BE20_32600 [Sorangium cellulosum]|nr:hypothetical protein BE20_32600 [Sorangium cellulosum]